MVTVRRAIYAKFVQSPPFLMFGKSPPRPGTGLLADRVRQLKERDAPPVGERLPPGHQKKRSPREPHFKQAVLILEGGRKLTVALKNLSSTGARIEMRERIPLPDKVVLSEVTLGLKRSAQVVWQVDGMAGLHFIEP
jgi:PilZ domain